MPKLDYARIWIATAIVLLATGANARTGAGARRTVAAGRITAPPVIDGVIDLYAADPELTVEREYAPALPRLQIDADQIARALKNVVGNAVEAMQEAVAENVPKQLHVRTRMEDEMARIEILDSGPGLTEQASSRLFQPYFTTKARGSGLGMAITYRIIVEHGGIISARNRSPRGAVVEIRLPLVPRNAGEPADDAKGPHA